MREFNPKDLPRFHEGGAFWLTAEGAEATEALAKMQGLDLEDLATAYSATFTTPAGQTVLRDLLFRTIMQPTWVPGEAEGSAYVREGQNSFARYITQMMGQAGHAALRSAVYATPASPVTNGQPQQASEPASAEQPRSRQRVFVPDSDSGADFQPTGGVKDLGPQRRARKPKRR